MSVLRDDSGRRSVQVEVEVPGTPEEVWRAIATGPGISSWFVPTEVDGRVGGQVKCSFGPGMDSISTITVWDAPHRMAAESRDLGPDAPPVATEWIVEASSGGQCIVRVVHSLFADSDDWDRELASWEGGWPDFFRILRLYLTHYAGQPGVLVQLSASTSSPPDEAWKQLCAALGLVGITAGEERAVDGPTPLDVCAEHVAEGVGSTPHTRELLLRTSAPTPGLVHWFAMKMGEPTYVSMRFYLYGDAADENAGRIEPAWQTWLSERFPSEA